MVWKQDLAKLKKDLQESGDITPKVVMPKPAPKPEKAADIQDEDALFLMAMGKRQSGPAKSLVSAIQEDGPSDGVNVEPKVKGAGLSEVRKEGVRAVEDFQEAMQSLKGLKATSGSGILEKAQETREKLPKVEAPKIQTGPCPEVAKPEREGDISPVQNAMIDSPGVVESKVEAVSPIVLAVKEPAPLKRPHQINLAAGMAIDVDGALDLRGHSRHDALERLRERVQDGVFLGWRTLHVTLGADEDLRNCLLDYLVCDEAMVLCRYAQAPIPMGGANAWILYYPSH